MVFKILSNEKPFSIDITKDNIEFNEFNITRSEPISLKLVVKSLENDYAKKISIANIEYNEINKIVSIQKNKEEYKSLNFPYYTFEKGATYNLIINFNKKQANEYTLEKTNIIGFSSNNLDEFSKGNITYNDIDDKFIIINWSNITNILITIKKNKAKMYLSKLSESEAQSKKINLFQNLQFTNLDNLNISKPLDSNYSLLYIELYEKETEIEFDANYNKKDEKKDKKDNDGISTLTIVLISVFGFLVIVVILFFIIRNCKKKNSEDFEGKTKTIENEKLMSDI